MDTMPYINEVALYQAYGVCYIVQDWFMCRDIFCIACVFLRLSLSKPTNKTTNHMNVVDKSCPFCSTMELTVTTEGQGLFYMSTTTTKQLMVQKIGFVPEVQLYCY